MCYMSGHRDPTRTTTVELTKEELYLRVKKIAKPASMVDGDWTWGLEPYDRTHTAPKVKNPNLIYSSLYNLYFGQSPHPPATM